MECQVDGSSASDMPQGGRKEYNTETYSKLFPLHN